MSRVAELLTAIASALRTAEVGGGEKLFRDVRVELDRYDLGDLLKESTKSPAARVCFLAGKPMTGAAGGVALDVSVAIVVVSGRQGRANPEFASADLDALERLAGVGAVIIADPYVGLGRVSAADLGEQLVAVSEATSGKGLAIALIEVKWRLLDVFIARPAIQAAIETGRNPIPATQVAINDGEPEPPTVGRPEAEP